MDWSASPEFVVVQLIPAQWRAVAQLSRDIPEMSQLLVSFKISTIQTGHSLAEMLGRNLGTSVIETHKTPGFLRQSLQATGSTSVPNTKEAVFLANDTERHQ